MAYRTFRFDLHGCFQVLTDAFAAEDMSAFAHDGIVTLVQAESAGRDRQSSLAGILAEKSFSSGTFEHHVGMAGSFCIVDMGVRCHLDLEAKEELTSHACKKLEDIGIVVQKRVRSDIGGEGSLNIGVKRSIELLLFLSKVVSSELYSTWTVEKAATSGMTQVLVG